MDNVLIILKVIIFTTLALFSYGIADKFNAIIFVALRRRKGSFEPVGIHRMMKQKQYKGFLQKIDDWLMSNYRGGRTLNLNATKYIAVKVALTIVLPMIKLLNNGAIPEIFISTLIGFFAIDIHVKLTAFIYNRAIDKDMPTVVTRLYLQLCASVPFEHCLRTLAEGAKDSWYLRDCLSELYVLYQSSLCNIEYACDRIEKRFSNPTMSSFLMGIKQYAASGEAGQLLKRLTEHLQAKEEERIEASSSFLITMAAFSMFLIVINCMLVSVYPMLTDSISNFNDIFK